MLRSRSSSTRCCTAALLVLPLFALGCSADEPAPDAALPAVEPPPVEEPVVEMDDAELAAYCDAVQAAHDAKGPIEETFHEDGVDWQLAMYEAMGKVADVAPTDDEAAAWRTMAEVGPKMAGSAAQLTATREEVVESLEAGRAVRPLVQHRCGMGLP
jgi:hypothetical protein